MKKFIYTFLIVLTIGAVGTFAYYNHQQVTVLKKQIAEQPTEVVITPPPAKEKTPTKTVNAPTVPKHDDWKELDDSIPDWINTKKISIESIAKLQIDLEELERNKHTVVFEYVGAKPYMDSYGVRLAQNYMDVAKDYKAVLDEQIIVIQNGITIIDKLITAIQGRNDSALEAATVLIESNISKRNAIMAQSVQLHAKELESLKIVAKYKLESF